MCRRRFNLCIRVQCWEALTRWVHRYAEFIGTKRGLATALHSGDSAFATLPDYFDERLRPVLQSLLEAAAAAGEVRSDVAPDDLLQAVGSLCMRSEDDGGERKRRMVSLLIDGLHYGMKAN